MRITKRELIKMVEEAVSKKLIKESVNEDAERIFQEIGEGVDAAIEAIENADGEIYDYDELADIYGDKYLKQIVGMSSDEIEEFAEDAIANGEDEDAWSLIAKHAEELADDLEFSQSGFFKRLDKIEDKLKEIKEML